MLFWRALLEEPEDDVGQIERDAGDADGVHAGFGRPAFGEQQRAAADEEADDQADQLQAEEDAGGRFAAEAGVVELEPELADFFFGLRLQRLGQRGRRLFQQLGHAVGASW